MGRPLLLGMGWVSLWGVQLEEGLGLEPQGGSTTPVPEDLGCGLCESTRETAAKERIPIPEAVQGRQGRAGLGEWKIPSSCSNDT